MFQVYTPFKFFTLPLLITTEIRSIMCFVILLDLKIWPLCHDLVNVSGMPPWVALIKAAERFACFVWFYFIWMPQSTVWGVAQDEEEEQLDWTRSQKAWVPLPATHLTSSCFIFLYKILSLCALELDNRENSFLPLQ